MISPRTQRRLAAILAADVVGFSRLMEQDEAGTLAALKSRRTEILVPLVARFQGRVVKLMGDGVLIEFGSAVDAVQCAVALQEGFGAAHEGVPEVLRIVLRIGINLGDVIVEGSDIYGDGVNVAARLEALAEPGGVVVSASVHDQIIGKIAAVFDDLGERTLKNIAKPVRIFRVTAAGRGAAPVTADAAIRSASIAILPFANLGDDPAQSYFSDGFTEDIITELSRWRHLSVQSRSASFRYRGVAVDVKQAAREMNVRYIVEGSIRRIGARVRITAQLIDTETGSHVWAEKFDRDAEDLFAVQDQVVQTIVSTLMGKVLAAEADRARRKPPASLAAYECVLKGNALPWDEPEGAAEATRLFAKAIELDPGYGFAHACLAVMLNRQWESDPGTSDELLRRSLAAAKRAVDLDPSEATSVSILGYVYLFLRSFDQAQHFSDRALEVNPNNQWIIADRGELLAYLGRAEEGLRSLTHAAEINPRFGPQWYFRSLGNTYMVLERYPEALAAFGQMPTRTPLDAARIAGCHARLGNMAQAEALAAECLAARPDFSVRHFMAKEPYKNPADAARMAETLAMAGLPQ